MSEANVDPYEVENQPSQVNEPDLILIEAAPEDEPRGELLKFGLLAVVLLFTVLIIALLRPYIFNTIIPAVLGEGQPVAPLVLNETEAEAIKPAAVEEQEEEDEEDTAVSTPEATEEAAPEPVNPEDFPTAVPAAQTHTVQAGENLTTIAQRYGTTVQALVAANQISNPDRVNTGTVLTIPDSQ